MAAAANVSFGSSTLLAGYRWFKGDIGVTPGTPQRRNNLFRLGYGFQATPALTLTGAGYHLNNKRNGEDPWMLLASANYTLSKRTDAFLNVGNLRNKNNSNLGLNGFGSTVTPRDNQTGVHGQHSPQVLTDPRLPYCSGETAGPTQQQEVKK
nr:porin [Cupriavidus necator]